MTGKWMYFTGPWETISRVRVDGSEPAELFTENAGFQPNVSELVAHNGYVYFLVKSKAGCAPTDIVRVNGNTGTVETLLKGQDCIFGLTADDNAVYFGARKPTDSRGPLENGLYRLDLPETE